MVDQLPEVVKIELDKLRDEVQHLKHCQLDYTKFSTGIFTATIAAIGAVLFGSSAFTGANSNPFESVVVCLICIGLAGVTSFTLPYMAWVIIHKCRSIFRIVSYVRVVEESYYEDKPPFPKGYERTYSKLRKDPWLLVRTPRSSKSWKGYNYWVEQGILAQSIEDGSGKSFLDPKNNDTSLVDLIQEKRLKKAFNTNNYEFENWLGDKMSKWINNRTLYIGDYYKRLVKYIMRLHAIMNFIITITFLSYAGTNIYKLFQSKYGWQWTREIEIIIAVCIAIPACIWAWSIIKQRRNKRYILELVGLPFSQKAHYKMWKRALNRPDDNS